MRVPHRRQQGLYCRERDQPRRNPVRVRVLIPLADANEILDRLCERGLTEKTRYRVPVGGLIWEVDEFDAGQSPWCGG